MKYLIVLAIIVVAVMLWRSNRRSEQSERASQNKGSTRPAPGQPQDMVSCPVCSVHLPRAEALPGADGRLYCSNEHRLTAGG